MATRIMMAILLEAGDTILWLPPESEDLELVEVKVKHIHNADPVAGKLRIETTAGDISVSCKAKFHVVIPERTTP